ncbi:MAG TPA: glutamate--tRNA ligase, partial [Gemmatimonadaceae bacterium]|nr:glutamate--tRNA ligase [Gemmatimonadaceae bacterium]
RCARLPAAEVDRRVAASEPHVIRFRVPEGSTTWDDVVHGEITFPNKDIDDFVVLRSDSTPIYNLAVVSDDIAMGITLVMRGDDHISNTPKQIMLYRALDKPLPRFAHLPMIHGTDGKKLSKRHGATAVGDYEHMGLLPEAMLNFLALLGWAPGNDIEVMSMDDMVRLFTTDGLSKKAAVFDPKKLEWMNGQHLSRATTDRLLPIIARGLEAAGLTTISDVERRKEWYASLLDQLKVRARTTDEIVRQAMPYLLDTLEYDADAVAKQWKDRAASATMLSQTRDRLAQVEAWTAPSLEEELRQLAESMGVSAGKLFQPMRVALTGMSASPGIFEVLMLLGKERSLERLDAAVSFLNRAA